MRVGIMQIKIKTKSWQSKSGGTVTWSRIISVVSGVWKRIIYSTLISSVPQKCLYGPGHEGHELQWLYYQECSGMPREMHKWPALSLFYIRNKAVSQRTAPVSELRLSPRISHNYSIDGKQNEEWLNVFSSTWYQNLFLTPRRHFFSKYLTVFFTESAFKFQFGYILLMVKSFSLTDIAKYKKIRT